MTYYRHKPTRRRILFGSLLFQLAIVFILASFAFGRTKHYLSPAKYLVVSLRSILYEITYSLSLFFLLFCFFIRHIHPDGPFHSLCRLLRASPSVRSLVRLLIQT